MTSNINIHTPGKIYNKHNANKVIIASINLLNTGYDKEYEVR
jgi:hypothetical protein